MDIVMDENNIKNKSFKFTKTVVVVVFISLMLNITMYFKLSSMNQMILNLRNNINSINNSISSTMHNNISQINEMLRKESSIVTEFKYDFINYKDKKVDVLLNVKPKVYNNGEKLYFSYKIGDNSPKLIEAISTDGLNFESKVNMSIFDSMNVDLIIDDGNSKKNEKLNTVYSPAEKFTARLNAHGLGGSISYNKEKNVVVTNYEFELHGSVNINDYVLKDVNLEITVNDKIIDNISIPKDKNIHENSYYIKLKNYEVPCNKGETLKFYITAKDNKGFNYKCLVEAWQLGEDGYSNHYDFDMDLGVMKIY